MIIAGKNERDTFAEPKGPDVSRSERVLLALAVVAGTSVTRLADAIPPTLDVACRSFDEASLPIAVPSLSYTATNRWSGNSPPAVNDSVLDPEKFAAGVKRTVLPSASMVAVPFVAPVTLYFKADAAVSASATRVERSISTVAAPVAATGAFVIAVGL